MVKIRLHGTPGEVDKALEKLTESFKILSVSDPYADRGKSQYVRVYVECE